MMQMKKLGAAALCLLLVCSLVLPVLAAPVQDCPGGCGHQAAVGTTHYDTLAEAVAAAEAGSTVTLLADLTFTGLLSVDKALTLDLGGNTLTGQKTDNDVFILATGDLTVKNGTLSMTGAGLLRAEDCKVTVEKDAELIASSVSATVQLAGASGDARLCACGSITNQSLGPVVEASSDGEGSCGVVIGEGASLLSRQGGAVRMKGAGALEITGGELTATGDAVCIQVAAGKTFDIAFTGGLIRTDGETLVLTLGENSRVPETFVEGGTYTNVPSAYVPDHCRVTDNGDGTYTVTAAYTLSFGANGGYGTMEAQKADRGATLTLPECAFTAPDGKHFLSWEADGNIYTPGQILQIKQNMTLQARWEEHSGGTATCQKKAVCKVCGESYGKKAAHNFLEIAGYGPSCTQEGMNAHQKCSNCGGRFVNGVEISLSSLTVPAMGHEWQSVEGVVATCESQGLRDYKQCENCGQLRVEGSTVTREELIVPATGHVFVKIPAIPATCTQAGIQAHEYCSGCGQHFLNGFPVEEGALTTALASHVLSDWQGDAHYHWKSCVDCGAVFRLDAHKDADGSGSCDSCEVPMEQPVSQEAPASAFRWWPIPVAVLCLAAVLAAALIIKKKKHTAV